MGGGRWLQASGLVSGFEAGAGRDGGWVGLSSVAMRIDIITLFPEIAMAPLEESIVRRARAAGLVEVRAHQLRDWASDKHRQTDDYPCGGGPGMLLKPEPVFAAVEELRGEESLVVLMTPQGRLMRQDTVRRMAAESHLILICGHYEGVDHRVVEAVVDLELSIGDYILTNGALAAAVVCDAVIRLLPGALGDERSSADDSFGESGLLEAPAFTRPVEFRGLKVPEVLLSGHHARIARWRHQESLARTRLNRPDLAAAFEQSAGPQSGEPQSSCRGSLTQHHS